MAGTQKGPDSKPSGGEASPRKSREPSDGCPLRVTERDVLASILAYLDLHPRVAWFERMNTGGVEREYKGQKRYIRFAFKGCSDIIGQLDDGRFLAIEAKSPTGEPTAEQIAFLSRVVRAGGVGFVARGIDDVRRGLP